MSDAAKRAAAVRALDFVEDGMVLGLGTGSTAALMVEALADRVATGLRVAGVPTSRRTEEQARALGVPLTTLEETPRLDLTIDGADEVDPARRLIKGGGGALLREKIVAAASARMVVITEGGRKEVATLGAFPLPVEVVRFGLGATRAAVADLLARADVDGQAVTLRGGAAAPYVTDEGHYILDLALGRIGDPEALDTGLRAIPGVVETGLFLGLCDTVVVGERDGTARVIVG